MEMECVVSLHHSSSRDPGGVWEGGREVGVWEGGSVGVWEGGWEDERSDEEERGTIAGSPGLRLQSV